MFSLPLVFLHGINVLFADVSFNIQTHHREKHAQEEDNKALAQAPSTILSGDALPDIGGLDLLFKPSMGEMSSLALPENLPLDFIASKWRFLVLLMCVGSMLLVLLWTFLLSLTPRVSFHSPQYITLLLFTLHHTDINFTAGLDLPSIAPSAHLGNKANFNLPQITDGITGKYGLCVIVCALLSAFVTAGAYSQCAFLSVTVGSASSSAYAPPPSARAAAK